MNAYFFNLTREEKENILNKHKHVYDGFTTQYVKPNQQPLYVQDFANDKGGITVNNKGLVTNYKNVGINEDIMSGAKFEPEVNIESDELEEKFDMIGDGDNDLSHGTFSGEEPEFDDLDDLDVIMLDLDSDSEEEDSLKESINESLDMFRRFKKY